VNATTARGTGPPLRVDAHTHLSQWWPDIRRTAYRPDLDFSVGGLLAEMDAAGIDVALVLQLFQAPSEQEALAEGRRLYEQGGGRLLPVATVDPTRGEESVQASVQAIEKEAHIAGIKLYPGYRSFYPADGRLDPVYELAHRLGVPVLFHQGDTLDGLGLLKFARPLEVDEVAGRYRDVPFVLCHLGNPWIDEAAELVYKNPNVYTDTSGLLGPPSSPYFARSIEQSRERLQAAVVSTGLPDRFLGGSDWPLGELWVAKRLIGELDLAEADREAILGGNAVRLFRITHR
jgi:uncharacterized protein